MNASVENTAKWKIYSRLLNASNAYALYIFVQSMKFLEMSHFKYAEKKIVEIFDQLFHLDMCVCALQSQQIPTNFCQCFVQIFRNLQY